MSKKLVAYFSASGVTETAAKVLAEAAEADLYEIKPTEPYTREDLNWNNRESRSSLEMNDKASRPTLADKDAGIEKYDVIFLGFPIWWYTAPRIINTFLESYDFSGRQIILFATSGGSGFGKTKEDLKVSISKQATIVEGKLLNGKQTKESLKAWVESLEK